MDLRLVCKRDQKKFKKERKQVFIATMCQTESRVTIIQKKIRLLCSRKMMWGVRLKYTKKLLNWGLSLSMDLFSDYV